jgi:hypothetical protein
MAMCGAGSWKPDNELSGDVVVASQTQVYVSQVC